MTHLKPRDSRRWLHAGAVWIAASTLAAAVVVLEWTFSGPPLLWSWLPSMSLAIMALLAGLFAITHSRNHPSAPYLRALFLLAAGPGIVILLLKLKMMAA